MQTAEVGLFHLPVGCPRPPDGTKLTRKYVESWLKENKDTTGFLQRTSYGTYAGIAAFAAGVAGFIASFKSDNPIGKCISAVLGVVGAFVALIGKFCGIEYDAIGNFQDKVLFNPPKVLTTTPEKEGIPHEEVTINTPDGEALHGFYLPSPVETRKTVLYLHGRANNIGNCLKDVYEIQKKVPVNVLMIDYRGFGKSTLNSGRIDHEGLLIDAEAMYDYLINQRGCNPDDISLVGHSLGGAVAIELATKRKVNGLVVESSFTTIKDVAKDFVTHVLPDSFVSRVTSRNEFNSIENIKNVKAKRICVIHGTGDRWILPEQGEKLFEAAPGPKNLFLLEGAGHSGCLRHLNDWHIDTLRNIFGVDVSSSVPLFGQQQPVHSALSAS